MRVQKKQEQFAELLDHITAFNGKTMIINGCYELQLRVQGRNISGTFFVLPDLTQDLILGRVHRRTTNAMYWN